MCYHVDEALSPEEIRERHRFRAAEAGSDDGLDESADDDERTDVDEPAETDDPDPPGRPRVPAGD